MPRGIYPRRPQKTTGIRGAVISLLENGWSEREVGKIFAVSGPTIHRIKIGDWNSGRKVKKMIGISDGDLCPKCGMNQMPKWGADTQATARACQNCGHVEELNAKENKVAQAGAPGRPGA